MLSSGTKLQFANGKPARFGIGRLGRRQLEEKSYKPMSHTSLMHSSSLTYQANDPSRALAGASVCVSCSPGAYSNAAETQDLVLTQAGKDNNGGCAGVYLRDPLNRILNGFPVWINPKGNRFIGWDTSSMSCYILDQLGGFVAAQGFFPSYNINAYSPDVTCCWYEYAATLTQPGQTWSKYMRALAGECCDQFCVSLAAITTCNLCASGMFSSDPGQ